MIDDYKRKFSTGAVQKIISDMEMFMEILERDSYYKKRFSTLYNSYYDDFVDELITYGWHIEFGAELQEALNNFFEKNRDYTVFERIFDEYIEEISLAVEFFVTNYVQKADLESVHDEIMRKTN